MTGLHSSFDISDIALHILSTLLSPLQFNFEARSLLLLLLLLLLLFKLEFTPCKAEQPLPDMKLQEKEAQKD